MIDIKDTCIVNLTPHPVTIVIGDGFYKKTYPKAEAPARCKQENTIIGYINGIAITKQVLGEVIGLPAPEDGVYFIVSRVVASACPDRTDLLIPGQQIRNEEGNVIGCEGWSMA